MLVSENYTSREERKELKIEKKSSMLKNRFVQAIIGS